MKLKGAPCMTDKRAAKPQNPLCTDGCIPCSTIGHGGNIYRASQETGIPEEKIIDFSASINPLGVPGSVMTRIKDSLADLCNYPDPYVTKLRSYLSQYHDVDPSSIVCGNGSTELIYVVVRTFRPERVLLAAPTFGEYERACSNHESRVMYYPLEQGDNFDLCASNFISAMAGNKPLGIKAFRQGTNLLPVTHPVSSPCDMAFLCNPNNPTGRLIPKAEMIEIAKAARDLKCHLIVDEAFIDFSPDDSMVNEVRINPYLIVLRSLTKFYALPGLRIGYGIIPLSLIDAITRLKEPWTVNTLAQIAGITALKDNAYKDETFKVIRTEKMILEEGFRVNGIDFCPSCANYYLLKLNCAKAVVARLRGVGILIRDCSNFEGLDDSFIRVAVKSHGDNMRLLKELASPCRA